MLKKYVLRAVLTILFIFLLQGEVWSGITGKIMGIVTDKTTGEPLFGANVFVVDTYMGAATDSDGRYFIINVSPGIYEVEARMMGYTELRKSRVAVHTDRTTTINFELQSTVLEAGETVVVVAERELVRKDVSFSQTNLGAEVVESIPAAIQLDQTLVTQAGVHDDGQGLIIRGGDRREINYYVDGLNLRMQRTNRSVNRLSKTAIEEVQLLTGGFSAEFGDARSGIVNVVTKNPGKGYFFNFEARYSPLWGKYDGRKHFGSYIYSKENWWEYGRFMNMDAIPLNRDGSPFFDTDGNGIIDMSDIPKEISGDEYSGFFYDDGSPLQWINENSEDMDRDKNGIPDFYGWNWWAANKKFSPGGQNMTPREAYEVWAWQHRSIDSDGNILIDGKPFRFETAVIGGDTVHYPINEENHHLNHYGFAPDYNFDFSFGGPLIPGDPDIPLLGKVRFLASHRRENTMYPFFSPEPALVDQTSQLKLMIHFTPSVMLTINGLYADVRSANKEGNGEGYYSGDIDHGNSMLSLNDLYQESYNLFCLDEAMTPRKTYISMIGGIFTHTLSSKTFYELKMQYSKVRYLKDPRSRYRQYNYSDNPAVTIGSVTLSESPKGVNPMFNAGDYRYDLFGTWKMHHLNEIDFSWEKTLRVSGHITSQIHPNHLLKAGSEFNLNRSRDFWGGVQYPEFYWDSDWPEELGTGHTVHENRPVEAINTWQLGLFVQDRMEYGGMILNLGLRTDIYRPNNDWYDRSDPYIPTGNPVLENYAWMWGVDDTTNYYGDTVDSHPPMQFEISPRFGIAHPMGPESKIYFNYGHFYQIPNYYNMYAFVGGKDNWSHMQAVGNPWLKMPKTIQMEAGYEQRLFSDFVVNVSGYYKDVTRDIVGQEYQSRGGTGSWPSFINAKVRDIKGFEVSIRKAYGRYITGFINSDYSIEKRSDISWQRFNLPEDTAPDLAEDPELIRRLDVVSNPYSAARQYPADWRVKASINLNLPEEFGFGPIILGSRPFGNLNFNIYHEWRKGRPYTYNPDDDPTLQYALNRRQKDYNMTNLRIEKRLSFSGITMTAFLEITNLLNYKNVYSNPPLTDYTGGQTDYKTYYELTSGWDLGRGRDKDIDYVEVLDREGKHFGDEVDDPILMPQRTYVMWLFPRDYWFGIRFWF